MAIQTKPKAGTQKKSSIEVSLVVPQHGFRRYFRFNRFRVDPVDGGKLFQCAFLTDNGQDFGRYAAFITIADLRNNVPQIGPYLGSIGGNPSPDVNWEQGVQWHMAVGPQVDMVRHFNLARAGDDAEMALFSYPIGAVLNERKAQQSSPSDSHKINVEPLALLSSNVEAHITMLVKLFGDLLVRQTEA